MDRESPTLRRPLGALLLLAASAFVAADESRPPLPLRTPELETPVETAGTGLAPEVQVRVHIDSRGRVDDVALLRITPESEFDELFRGAARETLLRWRYAPAVRDGRPVETTLSWTVQFRPRQSGAQEELTAPGTFRAGGRAEDPRQEFRERVLSLPLDQRRGLLQKLVGNGMRHLAPGKLTKFASPRVLVYTDAPDPEAARLVAGNVESVFNVVQGLLDPGVEPQREENRVVVFLCGARAGFERLREGVIAGEWVNGFYHPVGLLAFHMEMPTDQSLTALMLHEATHAYVDRYVVRPGVPLPVWFGEGLAEYIGNSDVRDKQLVPGRTRRREVLRTPFLLESVRSRALYSVEEMRGEIRAGTAPTLARLLTTPASEFYADRPDVFYSMSWLAVHFLRHGDPGWAIERFPRLVLYLAEGYPSTAVVGALYGEPAELEQSFRKYILRFH